MPERSINVVIGENARLMRTERGHTLEEVADAARQYGAPWSRARVRSIELGETALTVENLFVLALALSDVLGKPIELGWLVHPVYADDAEAVANLPLDSRQIMAALSGSYVAGAVAQKIERSGRVDRVAASYAGDAERRAAKSLGVDLVTLSRISRDLWQHQLTIEREDRVRQWQDRTGKIATAQQRGRVTRELIAELRSSIDAQQRTFSDTQQDS